MIIYILILDICSADFEISDQNVNRITNSELGFNSPVDFDFMLANYDIEISPSEVISYRFHQSAWRRFEESELASCLIMEYESKLLVPIQEIETRMHELPEDWDIYFPFDHRSLTPGLGNTYLSVNQIGSYAYFLSNMGVKKLLKDMTIRLPVNDRLMAGLASGELNIYTDEITLISGQHWAPLISDRQKSIKNSIFSRNVWSEKSRRLLRKTILVISSMAVIQDVNLILDSGSLLGHIRHGQIMPWDDDVDLAIGKEDLENFLTQLELAGLSIGRYEWSSNCYYYKIWFSEGENISGFEHKFPFIDIWTFEVQQDKVKFYDGRVFEYSSFFPLSTIYFEGALFKIPNNSVKVLSDQYSDWATCIRIYPWCHRLEGNYNIPLKLTISVDNNGRFNG